MKKIALISSYCDSVEKIQILKENILKVKSLGLDTFVISPITLPSEIIELSNFVFFTKENPLLVWPVRSFTFWKTIFTNDGWVTMHHNVADYGWAGLYQIKKMSQIALTYEYDIFYHMIYDLDIDAQVESEIVNNDINLIHPRVNPNNPNDLWEATLHFMVFDRNTMEDIVNRINLDVYLNGNGVAEGQALKWAKEIPLTISEHPVKDQIYYWKDVDFFNHSKNENYRFFFSKNDNTEIWVGEPPTSEYLDGNLRIVFYNILNTTDITISVNDVEYSFTIDKSQMIKLDCKSKDVNQFIINDGDIINDLSKTIQNTNRNLIYLGH
jgi:hypothetical protein